MTLPHAKHWHAIDTAIRIILGGALYITQVFHQVFNSNGYSNQSQVTDSPANSITCTDHKGHVRIFEVVIDLVHFVNDIATNKMQV